MAGSFLWMIDYEERSHLLRSGVAKTRGTRRRIHFIQLIVPLSKLEPMGRIRVTLAIERDRYHFRDPDVRVGWKLKKIPPDQRKLFGPRTPADAYQVFKKAA